MNEQIAFAFLITVGVLFASYGFYGISRKQILLFARGSLPRKLTGAQAISTGVIYAVLGMAFAAFGGFMLLIGAQSLFWGC